MEKENGNSRNHLVGPRNVLNTGRIYRAFILKKLLKDKSLYGKQIRDALLEHFQGYSVPISYGTIYDTLHSMEEEGHIESHWDTPTSLNNRNKRYYTITDKGLEYYKGLSVELVDTLNKNKTLIQRYIDLLTK